MSNMHACQVLRFGRSHYGFEAIMKTTDVVGKNYGFLRILVIFYLLDNYSCRQYLRGNSPSSTRVALPFCDALVPGPNENVMVPRNEHSPADMQAMRRRE